MDKKYNVLYVDDEVSNLNVFKNSFRRVYNIFTAESANEGLSILEKEKIDLILTDQRMPEMSGVSFLKQAMIRHPYPNRILITAYTDFSALKDAVNEAKIFQFIQKPWDEIELQKIIDNALEIYELKKKNIELTEKLRINNEELSKLNNELLDLDKLKFQFLSIISHEIRTPLNGLIGATLLFKDSLERDQALKYEDLFQILELSTDRLQHFLILAEQITAFKAKSYKFDLEVFKINELVDHIVKMLNTKIEDKGISIKYEKCNDDEGNFMADRKLLEICLIEIIDNAIKYTPENRNIFIKTNIGQNNQVIEIIDEGPDFPENVLKHIYKPFISNESLSEQGMGLDLALINLIIEAHKGSIKIQNNPSKGSTVKLSFYKSI